MKISIITVCFNAERHIERAINSVLSQSYDDIEYIVVDGASKDATLEILGKYRDRLDCVVSEEDDGIYDAMNKAIRIAAGDLLFFLNSDDFFIHSDVVKMAVDAIGGSSADIYYGDLLVLNNDGKVWCDEHCSIDKFGIFMNFPTMPSIFYNRNVFKKVGLFSSDFRIVSDYLWIVSAFLEHNVKAVYLNMSLTIFQVGGISTDKESRLLQKREKQQVRDHFFTRFNWAVYKKLVKRRRKFGFFGRTLEKVGIKGIRLKRGSF